MDLTVLATPFYFATMAIERRRLARRAGARGGPGAGDYTRSDTLASLAMGVGSLALPLATQRLVRAFAPGRGRWARRLLAATAASAVATSVADRVVRRSAGAPAPHDPAAAPAVRDPAAPAAAPAGQDPADLGPAPAARDAAAHAPAPPPAHAPAPPPEPALAPPPGPARPGAVAGAAPRWATAVQRVGGVATMAGATVLASAAAADRTTATRMWRRGRRRDLGSGPLAWAVAIAGWDFVYYWNHRLMHEVRLLWAHHVVHHSSERYNLSTALRQPVSPFGVWLPYGMLARLGVRPWLIQQARGVNLLYQYWIHTETIDRLGVGEEVLNTPSHHRVHHGSNRRYLDRNHGSILIVWDRLFRTFEREDPAEPVVYGLTTNIGTFHPLRIATHEYVDMVRDVARSTTWRDRVSYLLRGPGWANRRRAEQTGAPAQAGTAVEAAATAA